MTLTLSGTFDSPDREDPFWFGVRSPFPAPDSTDPPPLLVDRDAYLDAAAPLGLTSEYVWDAYLALGRSPVRRGVARCPASWSRVEDGAAATHPGLATARLTSGLDTLFGLVDQRVKNLRVPILLVVFQIGAVTLAVLAGRGALTLTRQTFELAVLHSRGFSRRTLLAAQGVQALLYAAGGVPAGPAARPRAWPRSPGARTASSSPA